MDSTWQCHGVVDGKCQCRIYYTLGTHRAISYNKYKKQPMHFNVNNCNIYFCFFVILCAIVAVKNNSETNEVKNAKSVANIVVCKTKRFARLASIVGHVLT